MTRTKSRRCIALLPVALMAMLFSSCGPDAAPQLNTVKGSAIFEGKPAAGAIVTFHKVGNTDTFNLPHAKVQADGTFTLTSFGNGDGAPAGKYQVTIIWKKKKAGASDDEGEWMLPAKYLAASTSGIEVEIKSGVNALEPFQLTR